MPVVVVFALVASIASVAFLIKTVWFSVDHERSCQDLRSKAFESLNRGDASGARDGYKEALKEAEHSENLLQLPAVLCDLADVYQQQKDFPKAEECLTSALSKYEQIENQKTTQSSLQGSSLKTMVGKRQVEVTIKLAKLFEEEGQLSRALALYPKALEKSRSIPDSSGMDSDIEKDYARALEQSGQSTLARSIRADLAINSIGFGGFQSQLDEGINLLNDRHPEEAEQAFRVAALIAENHRVEKDSMSAQAWLAACALALGQAEDAERGYRKVLASNSDVNSMSEAKLLTGLAASLELQGKIQEAEPLYKRAMWLNRDEAVTYLCVLATQYEARNDHPKAAVLRMRSICVRSQSITMPDLATLISRAVKTQDAVLGTTILYLAHNYHNQNQDAKARPLYEAVGQIAMKLTTKDAFTGNLALASANYLCEAGEHSKAEPLYQKAIAIVGDQKLSSLLETYSYYAYAGNNCRALEKHPESEALYRRELSILSAHEDGRSNHPAMAQCLIDIAGELLLQDKYEQAVPFCQQAAKECQQMAKKDQIGIFNNKHSLMRFLTARGHAKGAQLISDQVTETTAPR
jgi:tetratricopeptide (TPR) repeat protein